MFNLKKKGSVPFYIPTSKYMRIPLDPHPLQCLVWPPSLILDVLIGVQWYLFMVLICLNLMTKDVEYVFTVYISFPYFAGWEEEIFLIFLLSFKSSLHILDTSHLHVTCK